MTDAPFISCLCPTYRRPRLLANALACFLAQQYPVGHRELVILDDGGDFNSQSGSGWELISVARRFNSLPEKFNTLAGLARGDIFVVWEDDDVYLPWHLAAHVAALAQGGFSKPSRVWSTYTGKPVEEAATGRFHGGIAFTRDAFARSGGWPLTCRADFDQQFLNRLASTSKTVAPCLTHPPSYVFRWGSTSAYHGQAFMRNPDDESWYVRCWQPPPDQVFANRQLEPIMDAETQLLMSTITEASIPNNENASPVSAIFAG